MTEQEPQAEPEPEAQAPFDVILAGGTVIDGTAEAVPYLADVGIRGELIAEIGDLSQANATRRIDCTGLVVCPGFIDPHTHVEIALATGSEDADAPASMGVTTVLTAPDGFGWAPLPRLEARELWEATKAIYGDWPASLDGHTESIAAYLDWVRAGTKLNVVPQVPHAAVRFAAMGWADGPASPKALDRMRGLVGDWMDAGAVGLAVGLEYEPGTRASTEELIALCEVVGDRGGSLAAHIRYLDIGRAEGYREVIEIGRRTGVRVNIAHEILDSIALGVLAETPPELWPAIETYLHPATSTTLATDVPREDRLGGPVGIARRLRDPEAFSRVEDALAGSLAGDLAAGVSVFAHAREVAWIGRDLHGLAQEFGVSAARMAAQVLRDDPEALFVFRRPETEAWVANTKTTLAHPATIIASDGIYRPGLMHPRGYGTFPRALWLATREWTILDLPSAIHAMTDRNADRYRLSNRHVLGPPAADVVVLDSAKVADASTFGNPRCAPIGIRFVLVEGTAVVEETGAWTGRPRMAGPQSANE